MMLRLSTTVHVFSLMFTIGQAVGQQPSNNATGPSESDVVQEMVAHAASHPDGQAPYSFDASAFSGDLRQLPIGVFDSGIGGLTVLEAILTLDSFDNQTLRPGADGRRDFENERFVYFGDQANMPYGNYAAAGKEDYLRELILKDVGFLLGKRYYETPSAPQPVFDKPPVKAIVIACNTATAYGLNDIRRAADAWQLPVFVVGVVEAGAQGVMKRIAETGDRGAVAVLATTGTCSSMAYPKAIASTAGRVGQRVPRVIQQGSVGLAAAVEGDASFITSAADADGESLREGYLGPGTKNPAAALDVDHFSRYQFDTGGLLGNLSDPTTVALNSIDNYARYDVTTLVENYRRDGGGEPISMVVLGCTHFPLVNAEIAAAFARLRQLEEEGDHPYEPLIAEKVQFVDPAELTAKELFRSLAKARQRADPGLASIAERDLFFLSVPNVASPGVQLDADGGLDRQYKYGRAPGQFAIEDTRCVPLTLGLLPEASTHLIRSHLPEVWKRLQ